MKYPDFLPENGTISFAAPSFGCATEPYHTAFMHALDRFHQMGYRTKLGPNCLVQEGIGISNTPQLCAKELQETYLDDEGDVIISCGGGELMCEILPYLDWEKLAQAKPKWYMGFSDNTNFTFLSATCLDTAAVYGPCAAAFGMEPWHESLEDAFAILTGKSRNVHGYDRWEREGIKDEEHPLAPYQVTEPVVLHSFLPEREPDGTAILRHAAAEDEIRLEGRLIGGCMDCLVNLLGTSFDHVAQFNRRYEHENIIWFMEACDLNLMSIRRAIWQMKNAGWFEHLAGFLIGRPLCFGEEAFGIDQYRAVTDLLAEYGVPVIMDLDIGHLPPMMPLVVGAYAAVEVKENDIQIAYHYR
jgi:muramoyltetrapeptide carboxypeptidase LdcA involved in peptidoglycan recycling